MSPHRAGSERLEKSVGQERTRHLRGLIEMQPAVVTATETVSDKSDGPNTVSALEPQSLARINMTEIQVHLVPTHPLNVVLAHDRCLYHRLLADRSPLLGRPLAGLTGTRILDEERELLL
jgi:hypothetical protein